MVYEDEMHIRTIAVDEARILRRVVLRPNLPPEASIFPGDDAPTSLHLGAFESDELVGVATLIQDALRMCAMLVGVVSGAMAAAVRGNSTSDTG